MLPLLHVHHVPELDLFYRALLLLPILPPYYNQASLDHFLVGWHPEEKIEI
jgi:hypothetical protein